MTLSAEEALLDGVASDEEPGTYGAGFFVCVPCIFYVDLCLRSRAMSRQTTRLALPYPKSSDLAECLWTAFMIQTIAGFWKKALDYAWEIFLRSGRLTSANHDVAKAALRNESGLCGHSANNTPRRNDPHYRAHPGNKKRRF